MKDYKKHDYNGYKTSPELVFVAIVLAYIVTSMSIDEILRFLTP